MQRSLETPTLTRIRVDPTFPDTTHLPIGRLKGKKRLKLALAELWKSEQDGVVPAGWHKAVVITYIVNHPTEASADLRLCGPETTSLFFLQLDALRPDGHRYVFGKGITGEPRGDSIHQFPPLPNGDQDPDNLPGKWFWVHVTVKQASNGPRRISLTRFRFPNDNPGKYASNQDMP